MSFNIIVNNSTIEAFQGETIMSALKRNAIRVPTLCYMSGYTPTGACRLCVVEVKGFKDLVTSCSYPVNEDMQIITNSTKVIKARKSIVELLLSTHPDDCLYCIRKGKCELQLLSEEFEIKERKFFDKKNIVKPDYSSTSILVDTAKCILCSRCVRICEETQYVNAIDFIGRGKKTRVNSAFNKGLNTSSCINCGQCITVCPTGALSDIPHTDFVQSAISSKEYNVTALISNTVITSLVNMMNLKLQSNVTGKVITALKKIGFNQVTMLSSACALNVSLEAQILADNLTKNKPGILFSSCCPAWVKFVEDFQPGLLQYISPVKSPQQIMGNILKTKKSKSVNEYNVAIIPCTAKKFEAARKDMRNKENGEVDSVITVRELINLFNIYGINLNNIIPENTNDKLQQNSSIACKMGYSGGKTEEIAKTVFELLNKGQKEYFKFALPKSYPSKKETKVKIAGQEVGFALVSGIANATEFINDIIKNNRTDIHYAEIMACPGGCVGGGGHNIDFITDDIKNRRKICVEMEKMLSADSTETTNQPENVLSYYFNLNFENIKKHLYVDYNKEK